MKTYIKVILGSVVMLVVGATLGWYAVQRRSEAFKANVVREALEAAEASDYADAARSLRAVELIEAGEGQQAIRILSEPIARFYTSYPDLNGDDRRLNLRSMIKALANSNEVIAARIAERPPYGMQIHK